MQQWHQTLVMLSSSLSNFWDVFILNKEEEDKQLRTVSHACFHALDQNHITWSQWSGCSLNGKVYPVLLTSSLATMWLLDGGSICQPGYWASPHFHRQRGDRMKVWAEPRTAAFWNKQSGGWEAQDRCSVFLIPESYVLWDYFTQEGAHYKVEGVKGLAAILH